MKSEDLQLTSEFLKPIARREINERFGRKNLNDWILSLVNIKRHERVLDVACGNGKQLLAYAELLDKTGESVGLDISSETLVTLQTEAASLQLPVRLVIGPMEDILSLLAEREYYDLISCCYGIYYSRTAVKTLLDFKELLKAGGRLVLISPDINNNSELYSLLNRFKPLPRRVHTINQLMRELIIPESSKIFTQLRCSFFKNPIVFPTVESFMEYWRSTDVYDPEIANDVSEAVLQRIQSDGNYTTTKRVLGLIAYRHTT